jgi:glycosyltransferase involved in cell wall biosynthesis
MTTPLVSIVTPFHNTREFLPECIESVLRQTYQNWEYVLVDNCSTDGSNMIATHYASQFPGKIRLLRTDSLLSQARNYNFALSCISKDSKYCKLVQADDWIYSECIARMVSLAESDQSIGIVSAYRLKGTRVMGDGIPYTETVVSGTDICRSHLTTPLFAFGSPTTILYRAELIRNSVPFYDEGAVHEDTDACYRLLRFWNFGFVHQILSFSRVDNDSITTRVKDFGWEYLDALLQLVKFGPIYLEQKEFTTGLRNCKNQYYAFLARRLLSGEAVTFWKYHISGLRSGGLRLERVRLARHICLVLLKFLVNPGSTITQLFGHLRKRIISPTRPSIVTSTASFAPAQIVEKHE